MSADDWGAPPASPADYGTSRGPVTQTTDVRMPARIDLRRTDDRWPFAQGADSSRSTRASPATANSGGARAGAPVSVNGAPQGKAVRFLIDHAASGLRPPNRSLVLGLHEINSSPSQLDVAPASAGVYAGQVFVAEWGDLAPQTTPLRDGFAGFQISRIDSATGRAIPFVRNRQRGPASEQGATGQGIERPYGLRFGPDGAMYIVDYGIARVNPARAAQGQVPYEFPPFTGAVWRVSRSTP